MDFSTFGALRYRFWAFGKVLGLKIDKSGIDLGRKLIKSSRAKSFMLVCH